MSFWKNRWLKPLILLLCLLPLAVLAWLWWNRQLGINSLEYVARYTGRWTLRFLLASLAITPLRIWKPLSPLVQFRRMLGLMAFFYGTLHALHYWAIDVQWDWAIIQEDLDDPAVLYLRRGRARPDGAAGADLHGPGDSLAGRAPLAAAPPPGLCQRRAGRHPLHAARQGFAGSRAADLRWNSGAAAAFRALL